MTWHRIGSPEELRARTPFSLELEGHSVAIFHHGRRFAAIGNRCNHKGGPLGDGHMRDESVVCPGQAGEYGVFTGKGPEGYEEGQVPVFSLGGRADGVYIAPPPAMPGRLLA